MIIKSKTSGNAGFSVDYLYDGERTKDDDLREKQREERQAEILMSAGVREPMNAWDFENRKMLIADFKRQSGLNDRVEKYMQHTMIAFDKSDTDKITDDLMKQVAEDYIKKAKLDNTQYIVIKHNDKEHKHIHILANRVDNDGKTVNNEFIKMRDIERGQILARKYNLTPSLGKNKQKRNKINEEFYERKDKGKNLDKTNQERLSPDQRARYNIFESLNRHSTGEDMAGDLDELKVRLNSEGISMQLHEKEGKIIGISFAKDDFKFSGVQVDKEYSYSKLKAKLENGYERSVAQQELTEDELAERQLKQAIENTNKRAEIKVNLRGTVESKLKEAKTERQFIEDLGKQGIKVEESKQDARMYVFENAEKAKIEIPKYQIKQQININITPPPPEPSRTATAEPSPSQTPEQSTGLGAGEMAGQKASGNVRKLDGKEDEIEAQKKKKYKGHKM
jgi:mannose/fructose/N-acetylgalactosamine-specific phosphotransferase system component IIB